MMRSAPFVSAAYLQSTFTVNVNSFVITQKDSVIKAFIISLYFRHIADVKVAVKKFHGKTAVIEVKC